MKESRELKYIRQKYFLGRFNAKSIVLNKLRSARNKLRWHLSKELNINAKHIKINQCVNMFCSLYNLKKPKKKKARSWLLELYISGENDIIKREDASFYQTREWKDLRKKTLLHYGNKCMKCGYEHESNCVDHIKPRSKYPELEMDFDNLQVLCCLCNLIKGNRNDKDYRKNVNLLSPDKLIGVPE